MSEKLVLKSGGVAGIAYVLVAFGAVTFASGTRVGEAMLQLSVIPTLWWVVSLQRHLGKKEGALAMLFLVGYVLGGALVLAQSANNALLAIQPPSAQVTAYVNNYDTFLGLASDAPGAVAIMAAGLAILLSRALPRWVGALGVVAGAGQLLLVAPLVANASFFGDSGTGFAVAQVVYVVWLLAVSVAMVLAKPGQERQLAPAEG